ncbi:SCO family protein [Tundrisphaera sp. TA3]|uniref:SCO family protein n=1 Tax=Tundrisphaera sp. TA3 TaxID=3435775 RepID=UPI003EBBDA92
MIRAIGWMLAVALGAATADAGSPLAVIGPAPEVKLIDAQGRPFDLATLRGKAVVVSFVFTTCNGTCPLTSAKLALVRDRLAAEGLFGKDVAFVSISLDPAHDTPAVLRRYGQTYRANPRSWHFLTGPDDEVARVVASWGMWARRTPSGTLDHPSRIFLIDPRGRQREIYDLESLSARVVLDDVRGLLAEEAGPG